MFKFMPLSTSFLGQLPYFITLSLVTLLVNGCVKLSEETEPLTNPVQAGQLLNQYNKADSASKQAAKTQGGKLICWPGQLVDSANGLKTLNENCQLSNLQALPRLQKQDGEILGVFALNLSSNNLKSFAFSVSKNGELALWNTETHVGYRLGNLDFQPEVISFAPRSGRLALFSGIRGVILPILAGEPVRTFPELLTRVSSLSFHPDENSILIGGYDGRIYRWRYANQDEKLSKKEAELSFERYFGHAASVSAIAFHPFGRVFFSADWNGVLSAWLTAQSNDPYSGGYDENLFLGQFFSEKSTRESAARPSISSIVKLIVTQDGQYLFLATQDGKIELWQVRGFKKLAELQAHKGLIYALAVDAQGTLLASSGRDGKLKVHSVSTASEAGLIPSISTSYEVDYQSISALAFLPQQRLFIGDSEGKVAEVRRRDMDAPTSSAQG